MDGRNKATEPMVIFYRGRPGEIDAVVGSAVLSELLPWLPNHLTPFLETHKALGLLRGNGFQSAFDGCQLRIHRTISFKWMSAKLAGDNGAKAVGICLRR